MLPKSLYEGLTTRLLALVFQTGLLGTAAKRELVPLSAGRCHRVPRREMPNVGWKDAGRKTILSMPGESKLHGAFNSALSVGLRRILVGTERENAGRASPPEEAPVMLPSTSLPHREVLV